MKKLSETYKKLGIAFTFPIRIKDANGKLTYHEDSDGLWCRYEYDANGHRTYCEDSDGYWYRCEYDANGKLTYYETSNGYWSISERDAKGNQTYYENSNGIKQGIPKAYITIDEEESIRFAEILKAAPTPPTPEFKRALRAYRDFIIGHIQ